jgi:hypothetical protein
MLKENDRIKMVKQIGGRSLVGRTFIVDNITDGIVNFHHEWLGSGYMAMEEFEEHFVIVDENGDEVTKVEEKSSKWTEWMSCSSYKYKTDNIKRVIVKSIDGYESKSSCRHDDTFSLKNGLDLCLSKIELKRANDKMKEISDLFDKTCKRVMKAEDRLYDILNKL